MCYYSATKNSKVVKFSMGIAEDNHSGLEKQDSQNQKTNISYFLSLWMLALIFQLRVFHLEYLYPPRN